jgi:hypothetical protein
VTGTVFVALLAGHLLGDWIVQTDRQAINKTTSWPAMQRHVLGYHATLAACVLPFWHTRWTALALAVSWVLHGFIDRRWPVRWLMRRTGSARFTEQFWGVLCVDQALHLVTICGMALLAEGTTP